MKALQRENRKLRQANDILRNASAYFCAGGARPPAEIMVAFIDEHRPEHGVEPICKMLPIAPPTYYDHLAKRVDPARLSERAKWDAELRPEIGSVFDATSASTASARYGASRSGRASAGRAARWRDL